MPSEVASEVEVDDASALLPHFERELAYLRRAGAEFARRYPKIAERLELSEQVSPDPHVERLIESFAFLAARIQHQIDQDLPLVASGMLDLLYPHLLEPVPSSSIARFEPDPEQGDLAGGYGIARHTPLFADGPQGATCRFRTCSPLTLWPLRVAELAFEPPSRHDFLDHAVDVAAVLRLRLERTGGEVPIRAMPIERLRFFLGGERRTALALYELLLAQTLRLAVLSDDDPQPRLLAGEALRPVGFADEEAVLPFRAHAHQGYRLLQEYFCFAEKFMFLEIDGLRPLGGDGQVDLLLLLAEAPPARLDLSPDDLALGCVPVVNLFGSVSEPIRLDHRRNAYRLVADARREATTEVHSIRRVSLSPDAGDGTRLVQPFLSFDHAAPAGAGGGAFWMARRRPAQVAARRGTEIDLGFLDLDLDPALPAAATVYAHLLCTNRGLAEELPAAATLQAEAQLPVARIALLRKPTRQLDPPMGGATLWRLVSHLALNHLSLSGPEGLSALREILKLYSFVDHASVTQQIMGIRELGCRRVARRIGDEAWRGFCGGTEVTLTFDERLYVGTSALLLSAVLSRFLGLHAAIDSFAQLLVRRAGREGIWKTWPATTGEQPLL